MKLDNYLRLRWLNIKAGFNYDGSEEQIDFLQRALHSKNDKVTVDVNNDTKVITKTQKYNKNRWDIEILNPGDYVIIDGDVERFLNQTEEEGYRIWIDFYEPERFDSEHFTSLSEATPESILAATKKQEEEDMCISDCVSKGKFVDSPE